jgi:ribonucleoside-diphosphate reductase alpha chain
LDNIVDYNIKNNSNPENTLMMRNKRKIGLGVCGFDDLLKNLSLQYGSKESIELAEELFSFINYQSKKASIELAKKGVHLKCLKSLNWLRGIVALCRDYHLGKQEQLAEKIG